nr:hypothetical protein [Tanacetum cinerariifolium]
MVINSPYCSNEELASPKQRVLGQMATGKENSNLFMADSLPITILLTKPKLVLLVLIEAQHYFSNESPLLGVNTPRCEKDSLALIELMVFLVPVNAVWSDERCCSLNTARSQASVSIKKSNDAVKLQALIDRKKVIIIEDSIRQNFRLDDADGIDLLPNKEIFAELAWMGYEKPSTKLTFYKAFFSAQWKFLIHTIASVSIKKSNDAVKLQALIDRMKVIIIENSIRQNFRLDDADGIDLLPNEEIFAELAWMGYEKPSTKLTFYKAFFSAQWKFLIHTIDDVAEVEEDEDNEVYVAPTPPSPTPATTPPPPQQEPMPSPPQAQSAQPSSPPLQQPTQPTLKSESSMTLLNILMETCIRNCQAQAEIQKNRRTKHSGLKRLRKEEIDELDADEDVTLVDVDAEVDMDANIQGRMVESQAKAYNLDLQHSEKVLSMHDTDEAEPAEVKEVLEVVTAAKLMTKVVTTAAPITIDAQVPKASAPKKRQLEAELNANINWNEAIEQVKRKERQDNKLVKERFESTEPKNFSDDFLINTLKIMFEKPNVEANVWRDQKGIYGLAKVKSWKLFDSCGVHIITLTNTHMFLLVEKKYPLTHFTLEQMLNNVRLEVEEESEMLLELLRLVRRQLNEGYVPE